MPLPLLLGTWCRCGCLVVFDTAAAMAFDADAAASGHSMPLPLRWALGAVRLFSGLDAGAAAATWALDAVAAAYSMLLWLRLPLLSCIRCFCGCRSPMAFDAAAAVSGHSVPLRLIHGIDMLLGIDARAAAFRHTVPLRQLSGIDAAAAAAVNSCCCCRWRCGPLLGI